MKISGNGGSKQNINGKWHKEAQFGPKPLPQRSIPEPSWKSQGPPEWETDPHYDLELAASQKEETAKELALPLKSHDIVTSAYIAKEILANLGGFEDIEDLIDAKIQELAYSDNAVEELEQRREESRYARGDYLRDQMKDDEFDKNRE